MSHASISKLSSPATLSESLKYNKQLICLLAGILKSDNGVALQVAWELLLCLSFIL